MITLLKLAGAIGVLFLVTPRKGSVKTCKESYECPVGTICWQGSCLDRGAPNVTYVPGEKIIDNVKAILDWFDFGDQLDGPITKPSQVDDTLNPFDLE